MPYKNVISLGTNCYVASLLKRVGLRKFSGPFDWIFSSAGMVRHCLNDDFATLLDKRHYRPVALEDRPDPRFYRCHHAFYLQEFGVKYVFNHHDVLTDEGYAYLSRCVGRFRQAVASGPTLLVQTRWDHAWDAAAEFRKTVDCLRKVLPGAALIAFSAKPAAAPAGEARLVVVARDGPHALSLLEHAGKWLATTFELAADERMLIDVLMRERFDLTQFPGSEAE